MTIKSTALKEKNITINTFIPTQKMKIKMDRTNLMPEKLVDSNFQCFIELEILICDEQEKLMAKIKLSYAIMVVLEKGEIYDSTEDADKIFNLLKAMFISSANQLLRETAYPPLPFDINF